MRYLDEPWYVDPEYSYVRNGAYIWIFAGTRKALPGGSSIDPTPICETLPEIAHRIVADHAAEGAACERLREMTRLVADALPLMEDEWIAPEGPMMWPGSGGEWIVRARAALAAAPDPGEGEGHEECCPEGAKIGRHNPFACHAYDAMCQKCRHIMDTHWGEAAPDPSEGDR